MTTVRIKAPDIAQGRSAIVDVDGTKLLLCRSAKGLHAMYEECPHQAMSLEGGRVRGASIICPHHGARFSLDDGHSMSPLTPKPLTLLPCREVDGDVEIEL